MKRQENCENQCNSRRKMYWKSCPRNLIPMCMILKRLVQPTIWKPTFYKISSSNMFGHSRMNSKHDGELCVMSSTFCLSGSAWLIAKSWIVQTLCTENPLLSRVGDGLRTRVSTGLADVVKITGSIPAPAPTSWTVFSGSIVACVVIGKEVNR